jgi:phosphatidylserine/phosphatidylglycerophosphate/cardiolipin synthase-like enzyme/uncharacterized membrane protein YdjX (TVP38/TMEM64 family)
MIGAHGGRAPDAGRSAAGERIARPGRNCWRLERASRFYCIQDAADYFRLVRQALLNARETVFILGWDLAAQTDLCPHLQVQDAPTRLDELLAFVSRRRPELRCYILTWDYGALHTLERDPLTRWRLRWGMPRGVRFGYDDHHPTGGCHHQKVVVVDDHLAFCGSVDLTGHRWDTPAHRVEEPARTNAIGVAYGPYHEVHAMVMGPVAAALGVLARDRWRAVGVERIPPVGGSTDDLWPSDTAPDLENVVVAISRTIPASPSQPAIRECEALFLDSFARAKRAIYIETQYFTSDTLSAALAARLSEPDGPEIVVITPKECQGWLEKTTMGRFRESLFSQLTAADRHNRLRLVYPAASRSLEVPTFVHSKVTIVDDVLLRIGSANCSQRSFGIDTECDLAVDASGDPKACAGISRVRDRLLGEHLGLSPEAVAAAIEHTGSLRALIDTQQSAERTLVPIELSGTASPLPALLRDAADPDEPVAFTASIESLLPAFDAPQGRSRLRRWILPAVVLVAAAGGAWRASYSFAAIPGDGSTLWVGTAIFVLAGLMLVPLELLAIAAGVGFGGQRGALVAIIGSLAAALVGYVAGRAVGVRGLTAWINAPSYRSIRQLNARGVGSIATLRLAHVASAASINLLSGAGRVRFAPYVTGTLITVPPTMAALGGLGGLVRHALLDPTLSNGLAAAAAALLLTGSVVVLRAFLVIRHLAPVVSGHRDRAEFG